MEFAKRGNNQHVYLNDIKVVEGENYMIFEKWKEEKIFLLILLTFGILILFLTPPMCTPDENTHFANAYSIGYGNIFPEVHEEQIGRYISKTIAEFIGENNTKYAGNLNEKYSFTEYYFDSWLPNTDEEMIFWDMGNLSVINPAGYLISAFGIWSGRILCRILGDEYATPYNLLLFARLFNAAFYMIVGYFAIKMTTLLKRTMLVILLMPMSIFLGVSVSYDAILIPVCALFFSSTFRMILDKEHDVITKKDIGITIFCTFFMLGIKTAYAPFLLLLLLIPIEKFGTKKRYITCVAATLFTGILVYLGYKIALNAVMGEYHLPENPLIAEQKQYFFSHLYMIPKIVLQTLHDNLLFYIQSFYGKLGQLDTNFALPIASVFYIMLGLVVINDMFSISIKIERNIRVLDFLMVLISIGGIFLAMYLNWTPLVLEIGGNTISGVQGRYFIPVFLFMCIPFMNGMLLKNKRLYKKGREISLFCCEVLAINSGILTCFILFLRYWC